MDDILFQGSFMTLYRGTLHSSLHGKRLEEKLARSRQAEADAKDDLLLLEHARDALDIDNPGDLELLGAITRIIARASR